MKDISDDAMSQLIKDLKALEPERPEEGDGSQFVLESLRAGLREKASEIDGADFVIEPSSKAVALNRISKGNVDTRPSSLEPALLQANEMRTPLSFPDAWTRIRQTFPAQGMAASLAAGAIFSSSIAFASAPSAIRDNLGGQAFWEKCSFSWVAWTQYSALGFAAVLFLLCWALFSMWLLGFDMRRSIVRALGTFSLVALGFFSVSICSIGWANYREHYWVTQADELLKDVSRAITYDPPAFDPAVSPGTVQMPLGVLWHDLNAPEHLSNPRFAHFVSAAKKRYPELANRKVSELINRMIRDDLSAIQDHGRKLNERREPQTDDRGPMCDLLLTFSSYPEYRDLPRIAKELGFRKVIAGVHVFPNRFESAMTIEQMKVAISPEYSSFTDGYIIGHNPPGDVSIQELAGMMDEVRLQTGKPATTSFTIGEYIGERGEPIFAMGDFLAVDVQAVGAPRDGKASPHGAIEDLQGKIRDLAELPTKKPILAKIVGYPSAPAPDYSPEAQKQFYTELSRSIYLPQGIRLAFFTAFDRPFTAKNQDGFAAIEEHLGLFTADLKPKLVMEEGGRILRNFPQTSRIKGATGE